MWLRLVLGAVYTAMAAGQAASFAAMPGILGAYQVGGAAEMRVLAVALIAGELAARLWFLARPRSAALTPVWIYTVVSGRTGPGSARRRSRGGSQWPTVAVSASTCRS